MEDCNSNLNVASMKLGEEGIICGLSEQPISLKLMEMGCIPGAHILANGEAPFGDPIKIRIDGEYTLSLRKAEASNIWIKPVSS